MSIERLTRIVHIIEHCDDLQPESALSRLQLDLVIEDARVQNDGGRLSSSSLATGVVQLADRVAHLEHVISMIGRSARGEP